RSKRDWSSDVCSSDLWARFGAWISGVVTGDFGVSLVSGEPVAASVWQAFGNTLLIAGPAIIVGVLGSILLGIWAASKRGKAADKIGRAAWRERVQGGA